MADGPIARPTKAQPPGEGRSREQAKSAPPAERPAGVERFVLDLDSNPHPVMLAKAIDAFDDAASVGFDPWDPATNYWHGCLDTMAAATGCDQAELRAWVLRHKGGA